MQVLHLDHNELEALPPAIFHMPNLRVQSPPTPNIQTAFLRQFTRCKVLTLSHNRLPSTCIPEVIDDSASPVQLQVVDM